VSGGNINAAKCASYLRGIGVKVANDTVVRWIATERETREQRRAANRELKKSCGHFRTYRCKVSTVDGWSGIHVCCHDCGRIVEAITNPRTPPRGRKQRTA
jgi:hypothetical protein